MRVLGVTLVLVAGCSSLITVPDVVTPTTELDCSSLYPALDIALGTTMLIGSLAGIRHARADCPEDTECRSARGAEVLGGTGVILGGLLVITGAMALGIRRSDCLAKKREQEALRLQTAE